MALRECREKKTQGGAGGALALFSTEDLLGEVQRRSLSCLCVCLRVDEPGSDSWHYRIKGSTILLGAMSAALTVKMQRHLAELDGGSSGG
ncbi:MAG: hypothetical protein M5U26_16795 [Planctomycetota bacterium]|nr:hypothetical protein [Planctomycetota bacterium]